MLNLYVPRGTNVNKMNSKLKILLWIGLTVLVSILFFMLFDRFLKLFPFDSSVFAFELHFLLMAWYAITIPVLKLDYDSQYYNSKSFEKKGRLYVYFGVNLFRDFLKKIGWNKISDKSNGVVIKDLDRLKKREKHTREAELAHLLLFIHFIIIIFYLLPNYNMFWMFLLNIIFHVYPVFLQRFNRPRYLKLISILESKER
ncbi:MAG: hypothetical protein WBF67_04230 [Olleya sp.]